MFPALIQKETLSFLAEKTKYQAKCRPPLLQAVNQPYLEDLRRDGMIVIPDFVSPETVQEILQEVQRNTDLLTDQPSAPFKLANYVIEEANVVLPSTESFFEHPLLSELARNYISQNVILYRKQISLKAHIGLENPVHFFHFDHWQHRLKARLFLTDVTRENAPLIYLKGSHKSGFWKLQKEIEFYKYYKFDDHGNYLTDAAQYAGHFFLPEILELKNKLGFEEYIGTVKAGTAIIFDAKGLHRGTTLEKGKRLFLSSAFNLEGWSYNPGKWEKIES